MRPGTVLWDKRDLDKWIDAMKEGAEMATQDAILGKL
jgi:predicted alpha/beta hydrolase family esterase